MELLQRVRQIVRSGRLKAALSPSPTSLSTGVSSKGDQMVADLAPSSPAMLITGRIAAAGAGCANTSIGQQLRDDRRQIGERLAAACLGGDDGVSAGQQRRHRLSLYLRTVREQLSFIEHWMWDVHGLRSKH